MDPVSPQQPRTRVISSRFQLPAHRRRRDLAHLARRATAAGSPQNARALTAYLTLARALGQV